MKNAPALAAALVALALPLPCSAGSASLTIDAGAPGPVINRNIYGQFSEHLGHCIYGGIWVGRDSKVPNVDGYDKAVIDALRELRVPILRWPGGCFADEYHWRDGIGPIEKRPSVYNSHWGGVVENNHFGTHEFLNLCEMLGIEPYVCVNVGSGTVQEAMEWVEYMTSDSDSPMANLRRANGRDKPWKVHFVAVGNESWGCGGSMRPEFYADNYRRYNTFIKDYDPANKISRIACGPASDDYDWTDTLMRLAGKQMDGLALHYYTIPSGDWAKKGSATHFGRPQYLSALANTLHMEELISRHSAIMDKYDPQKKVGLIVDEWGIWTDVETGTNPGFLYQQNSMRDAIIAALNLHIFQSHADRVRGANIAQMVNVLQSMILTDGARIVLTPTYHVFDMFKVHQGAVSIPVSLKTPNLADTQYEIPEVSASASRGADGRIHLSLVNTNPDAAASVACTLDGAPLGPVSGTILTASSMTAHNTFDDPHAVEPRPFSGARSSGAGLEVLLPPLSVVMLNL
ncbi:MAG TPA: alpha-L-arabinofuranosidase C-terminal domain-containing protein [Opitutaceae bacterium]|jgi:alpha-N-arabinofuranosidase